MPTACRNRADDHRARPGSPRHRPSPAFPAILRLFLHQSFSSAIRSSAATITSRFRARRRWHQDRLYARCRLQSCHLRPGRRAARSSAWFSAGPPPRSRQSDAQADRLLSAEGVDRRRQEPDCADRADCSSGTGASAAERRRCRRPYGRRRRHRNYQERDPRGAALFQRRGLCSGHTAACRYGAAQGPHDKNGAGRSCVDCSRLHGRRRG